MFSFFLLFLLVGFIIHLLIRHFFKKRNFVDSPDGIKKQHEIAVPISGVVNGLVKSVKRAIRPSISVNWFLYPVCSDR